MSKLLLDSLEIKGYRCFEHLTIEKLGRVNLIVGKNNVGKTALLEALWIYAERAQSVILSELLSDREERPAVINIENGNLKGQILDIRYLFYGRPEIQKIEKPVQIGSNIKSEKKQITISVEWHRTEGEALGIIQSKDLDSLSLNLSHPHIVVKINGQRKSAEKLEDALSFPKVYFHFLEPYTILCQFVKTNGLDPDTLAKSWDDIALTDIEGRVIEALHLIAPDVEKISFISNEIKRAKRVPFVRLKSSVEPVPLRSLGEGMNRLLGIALALVNCKNGMFFIDEIESGLHYSVLPDVWKLIFKTAKDLNVQVFATTHSYDCIDAFAQAAIKDKESDGMLIRLARKADQIKAFTFDEKQLETITKEKIEVR